MTVRTAIPRCARTGAAGATPTNRPPSRTAVSADPSSTAASITASKDGPGSSVTRSAPARSTNCASPSRASAVTRQPARAASTTACPPRAPAPPVHEQRATVGGAQQLERLARGERVERQRRGPGEIEPVGDAGDGRCGQHRLVARAEVGWGDVLQDGRGAAGVGEECMHRGSLGSIADDTMVHGVLSIGKKAPESCVRTRRRAMATTTARQRRDQARVQFDAYLAECPSRKLLDRISDKWVTLVLKSLADGPKRYSELSRRLAGVSQKMLT
jgi:hypothetical protein